MKWVLNIDQIVFQTYNSVFYRNFKPFDYLRRVLRVSIAFLGWNVVALTYLRFCPDSRAALGETIRSPLA